LATGQSLYIISILTFGAFNLERISKDADFLGLISSLLVLHHVCNFFSSMLHSCSRLLKKALLTIKQVSSVKRPGRLNVALGMSLTYIRNRRGPNMDPLGTPILINFSDEL